MSFLFYHTSKLISVDKLSVFSFDNDINVVRKQRSVFHTSGSQYDSLHFHRKIQTDNQKVQPRPRTGLCTQENIQTPH